jgi:GxxExxY protein
MNCREHGEHREPRECELALSESVINAAITVHTAMGPGLLESVYEAALAIELMERQLAVARQVEIPVRYPGRELGVGFRADLLVEDRLLIELKCVDRFHPVHVAQVITYLKLLGFKRSLLISFNQRLLRDAIKRVSI